MNYFDVTRALIKEIDRNYKEIREIIDKENGEVKKMHSWSSHFNCIWGELIDQLGWNLEYSRKLKLASRLSSLIGLNFDFIKTRINFISPIFKGSGCALKVFPEYVTYETAYGFRLCASARDMWQPMATGHYSTEISETFLISELSKHTNSFVDIGANIGFFSLLYANATDDKHKVFAFEPSSENFALFDAAIEQNNLKNRIDLQNLAVGEVSGEGKLNIHSFGSGGNTLLGLESSNAKEMTNNYFEPEKVSIISLDEFYDQNKSNLSNSLVKIDVEGFEKSVFKGAISWFTSQDAPIIMFEAWPDTLQSNKSQNHLEITNLLVKLGYQIYCIEHPVHRKNLLTELTKRNIKSKTGNYLAVPSSLIRLVKEINTPLDLREMSRSEDLKNLNIFLENSLENLKKNITLWNNE